MKISLVITQDVQNRPGDPYAGTKEETVLHLEDMDASPEVIASFLRGVADSIARKPYYGAVTFNGNTSGLTSVSG